MNVMNESRFLHDATYIADYMARRAIQQAVAKGSHLGSESYKGIDGLPIVVTARYEKGDLRVEWTHGEKTIDFNEAVKAISARMHSRMG